MLDLHQKKGFANCIDVMMILLSVYEHLQIRNMVKNRHLAKSIQDAGWGTFLRWVKHYGVVYGIPVIAVEPQFTSQDCSTCSTRVKKSLSVRTHICPGCGVGLDRDHNAALCILQQALAMYPGAQGNILDEENAWGEPTSTALSAMASQQADSPNQEPLGFSHGECQSVKPTRYQSLS